MIDQRRNLVSLTSVRFFAAMWVVIYHQSTPGGMLAAALASSGHPLFNLVRTGYSAVGLFFILSGFILAYTYRGPRVRLRDFWTARFARIYPVYVLGLLVTAPTILAKVALHLESSRQLFNGLLSLLLVQAWVPGSVLSWNIPGWSLSTEAFFYLLFPLLLIPIRQRSRGQLYVAMGVLWLVALAAPAICLLWKLPDFRGVYGTDLPAGKLWNLVKFNPLLRLPEFIVGMLLGRLFLSREAHAAKLVRNGAVLYLPGLVVLLVVCSLLSPRIPYLFIHNGLLIGCEGLMIYGLAIGGGLLDRLLSHRWLIRLGEASYAIYILHLPLDEWLTLTDKKTLHLIESHGTIMFAIYATVVIAASLAVFRWIEEPARKYLRKRMAALPPELALEIPTQPVAQIA